ncbi:DEAD/DEAH box helicase [Candidatus Woesearchaeota archaeon]|nr:DEAD/DEAH box helicase [Candidatus Woesearchaeota archaeon]
MKFEEMTISKELLGLLQQHNVVTPTRVQEEVLPSIFAGKDVLAQSETGSGKTLGFAIPLIERVQPRQGVQALVLAPTRELAQQIAKEVHIFSRHKQLRVLCVYGGVSINPQLERASQADIVIGTPGRVLDLLTRRGLNLTKIRYAVLDEGDRMLDMGFIEDIEQILHYTPHTRQTMLFSATIPEPIARLSRKYLKEPHRVAVEPSKRGVLTQFYYSVAPNEKFSLLVHLLKKEQNQRTLVFCKTRRTCQAVTEQLQRQHIPADSLHGGMSQMQRDKAITGFKEGHLPILVATDVAARGLHIDHVTHVYNYELPAEVETFIHRVGRTARAGESGTAISFVNIEDRDVFTQVLHHYDGAIARADPGQFPKVFFSYPQRQGGGFRGYNRGPRQGGNQPFRRRQGGWRR